MGKQKIICCPKCGAELMRHDGKSTIPREMYCRKCWVNVAYNPGTGKATAKKIQRRTCASGMTFH